MRRHRFRAWVHAIRDVPDDVSRVQRRTKAEPVGKRRVGRVGRVRVLDAHHAPRGCHDPHEGPRRGAQTGAVQERAGVYQTEHAAGGFKVLVARHRRGVR